MTEDIVVGGEGTVAGAEGWLVTLRAGSGNRGRGTGKQAGLKSYSSVSLPEAMPYSLV